MNNKTLAFYNKNAKAFAEETAFVDFKETQDKFINILQGKRVLDFGCGAGRDSKYFVEAGLDVVAIDGSAELCQIAESYVGIPVQQMLFQELVDRSRYDGIWACSSILHLPKEELKIILLKVKIIVKELFDFELDLSRNKKSDLFVEYIHGNMEYEQYEEQYQIIKRK